MRTPAGGWRDEGDVSFPTVSVTRKFPYNFDLYCNLLPVRLGFVMVMATFIVRQYTFMVVTQKQNLYLLMLLFR